MDWKSYPENGSAFHFISNMLNKKKRKKLQDWGKLSIFNYFSRFLKIFKTLNHKEDSS